MLGGVGHREIAVTVPGYAVTVTGMAAPAMVAATVPAELPRASPGGKKLRGPIRRPGDPVTAGRCHWSPALIAAGTPARIPAAWPADIPRTVPLRTKVRARITRPGEPV